MERDELLQRYHEVRLLLEAMVGSWPPFLPGAVYESACIYLDFHCAWCGSKLSMNDLAGVLELEMARLGTVDARDVPRTDPRCLDCYRAQQSGGGLVLPLERRLVGSGAPRRLLPADGVEDSRASG